MNDFITKTIAWIKANMLIAILIAVAIIVLFFGRQVKRLLFGKKRVHHRPGYYSQKQVSARPKSRGMRKPLPRSVGMHRAGRNGYAKVGGGVIPFKRNKDGSIKNAKFVAGTVAARNHMAKMRRNR